MPSGPSTVSPASVPLATASVPPSCLIVPFLIVPVSATLPKALPGSRSSVPPPRSSVPVLMMPRTPPWETRTVPSCATVRLVPTFSVPPAATVMVPVLL